MVTVEYAQAGVQTASLNPPVESGTTVQVLELLHEALYQVEPPTTRK